METIGDPVKDRAQSGAEVDPLILAGIPGFGYGEEEAPRDRCKIFWKGGSRTEYNLYASMKNSQSMKNHLLVARTGCGGCVNSLSKCLKERS